ncbi:MAG: PhoPQ-activated protein PqaA family protein [Planctomycetota bacterium]|nr:PhoPQ-activated protein PqaA family protein [Planctomycetota bacterium]
MAAFFCNWARADLAGYLATKDPSFAWSRIGGSDAGAPIQYAELYMVSQTWRDIVWKHKLVVVRPPATEKPTHAILIISGGSWRDGREREPMRKDSSELRIAMAIATSTRMPVAVLQQVPFQPIFGGLKEDQIISYTFDEYMKTGEEDWPLLLPMTKAAVRAMDAVQEVAREEWQLDVSKFIVTGASKRGWTTWLTGAMDARVAAIAPMVIDVLHMGPQMKKQREEYGGYSEQVQDYTKLKIQDRMDTEAGRKLLSIVDPYSHRARLTMPKLILLGTNDPYWTVDALNLYFDDLPGEKHILYVPNAGHGLDDLGRVVGGVSALALRASGKLQFPKLTWERQEQPGGVRLIVRSDLKPVSVSVWVATSPTRDFRQAKWTSSPMGAVDGRFEHVTKAPQQGYTAAFGEAVYEIDGRRLNLSTTIRVIGPGSPEGAK